MLGVWQQTEDLEARRVEMAIARERVVVELEQLVRNANIAVPECMRYTSTERSLGTHRLGQLTCTSSE
jgi:hypothetical protein